MTEITPEVILQARRDEVAQYEKNIALYQTILKDLPTEFPARLEKYKGVKNKHEAAAEVTDLEDVALLSKLWYAEDCKAAIRSEMVELTKSKAILAVLEAQAK